MYNFYTHRIAKNDSYEVAVEKEKNCMILSFIGVWDKNADFRNYFEDVKEALDSLTQGFNLYINLTQYKGTSSEFIVFHVDALKSAVNAGLNKTGVLMLNNPMLKITVDDIFKKAEINAAYFSNTIAIETWLGLL